MERLLHTPYTPVLRTPGSAWGAAETRVYHWAILAGLMALGLHLELRGIGRPSLWFDEYFSMFLSTGRGQLTNTPLDKPAGVVLAPFATGFAGAPPWWRIWTGMDSAFHPPLYHIVLRWWVDLFGDTDYAMRGLSVFFSMAGMVVLFDILRRTRGPWVGLAAAGLMSAAWAQIIMSQELRSYTMLVFLGLLLIRTMLMIQMRGPGLPRLILPGILAAAMMLTHYLAAGALAGMGLYALAAWRGRMRWGALAALAIAAAFVLAVWARTFVGTYHEVWTETNFLTDPGNPLVESAKYFWTIPANLTVAPSDQAGWLLSAGVFVLAMVLPVTQFRRSPDALLWWLWVMGALGLPLIIDLTHHYKMLAHARYVFLATPGLFALAATPPNVRVRWAGWCMPALLVACCIWGTAGTAPAAQWKSDDWPGMARALRKAAGPSDILVIGRGNNFAPAFTYIALNHYGDFSRQRMVYLPDGPLAPGTLAQLAAAPHVWVAGPDAQSTTKRYFPGWHSGMPIGSDGKNSVWQAIPPGE